MHSPSTCTHYQARTCSKTSSIPLFFPPRPLPFLIHQHTRTFPLLLYLFPSFLSVVLLHPSRNSTLPEYKKHRLSQDCLTSTHLDDNSNKELKETSRKVLLSFLP